MPKKTLPKNNLTLIFGTVILVVIIGGFYLLQKPQKVQLEAEEKVINHVVFSCDNKKTIDATFYQNSVNLKLSDGRNLTVPQAISASGARYANSDESFVFWNTGGMGFIQEGQATTYSNCAVEK